MPATISAVATAIQGALSTITGLRAYAYQPEQMNPPFAFPVLNSVDYHKAFSTGGLQMQWTVHVVVGRYTDRRAVETLDGYLSFSGATSIKAAIESDPTLGSVVQSLIVTGANNISPVNQDDADFLEVSFILTVYG